jgi:hypothetical protein
MYTSFILLCLAALPLFSADLKGFDGEWQMDLAQSHVLDGRTVTVVIAAAGNGVKMTMTAKKSDGKQITSEFTSKLDGKACDFDEGSHKSQLTLWFSGPSLNASKEKGPAEDVTAMWKFELAPDKHGMTLTINHYEPAADDEKLIFTKKST